MNTTTAAIEGNNPMNINRQTAIKESSMKITASKIIRWSGLSAMAAGIIFAGIQPIHPPDVLTSVNTDIWAILTSLKTVMSIFGLFGIAGLYARQVKETGWLGLAGYLLLTIFYAVQMCYSFAETLILPLLTSLVPTFVESSLGLATGVPGEMSLGTFGTVYSFLPLLYLLGLLLFGIAIFRARILSRWAALLLAFSGPLAFIMVSLLPHQYERLAAMPMGIALAWLGYTLWSERREPASEHVADLSSPHLRKSEAR
jgi:hypothetical protein